MTMKKRAYSRYTKEAMRLMGMQIQLGRKQKNWTEKELAERAGISRSTLQKMEKGEMSCAVGLVFEVAALVGLSLFEEGREDLLKQIKQSRDLLTLLPRRIKIKIKVDDDF